MAMPYEKKFAAFIDMLQTEADVVIISDPEMLGDDYEEMVESLNRLADAEKVLSIVPRPLRDVRRN
jgi:hypothetical protein